MYLLAHLCAEDCARNESAWVAKGDVVATSLNQPGLTHNRQCARQCLPALSSPRPMEPVALDSKGPDLPGASSEAVQK